MPSPADAPATLFTIGHSTRGLAEFSSVLQAHEIEVLVDIRAFPGSRRYPQFNREELELWCPDIGLRYLWMKDLGGRRARPKPATGAEAHVSPNSALRNDSFRNYADHMLTPAFQNAATQLLDLARAQRTAYMCAELLYFRCHRMLVSDYFVAHGHNVLHIADRKPPTQHALMKEARIVDGQLVYRGDGLF